MKSRILIAVIILALLSGCSSIWRGAGYEKTREGASSSLVDYLYPSGEIPPAVDSNLPYLSLPVRVGIAFVPSRNREDISAAEKQELMEHVADAFRDRDYVQSCMVAVREPGKYANWIAPHHQGVEVVVLE